MNLVDRSFFLGFLFGLLVLSTGAGLCFAQEKREWTTLASDAKDLTIEVPANFLVDKQEKLVKIFANADGASLTFKRQEIDDPKKFVTKLKYSGGKGKWAESQIIGDFLIRRLETIDSDGGVSTSIHVASSDLYYLVFATSSQKENVVVARFLNSLRIDGKTMPSAWRSELELTGAVATISMLVTSPEIATALARPHLEPRKTEFSGVRKGLPKDLNAYSRGLIILRRPAPSYTDSARMMGVQGTIKARVEFLKDGQIGSIVVDPFLDRGLAGKTVYAITKIKFLPAEVDGKPVDVTRIVEYGFSVY